MASRLVPGGWAASCLAFLVSAGLFALGAEAAAPPLRPGDVPVVSAAQPARAAAPRGFPVGSAAQPARAAAPRGFPVVETPLGKVRGVDYGDFVAFKGLPYAEPPRRFAAPVPKRPWRDEGVLDATHFGDACASAGAHQDSDPLESYGESEDCLFANVWRPKGNASGLPVVVWIHGGGFIMKTANFAGYWGDGFVTMEGSPVVLVTLNYRLGIFGFYSSEDAGANFGVQDQQMLLRWTRDNIAAFGGDPGRVTITGQSAGAMSVVFHLVAPGSRGLFQRAMASSPVGLHYRTPEENAPFVRTVSRVVRCSGAENETECLRSRPWRELKLADIAPEYLFHFRKPCPECDNLLPWMPVVDGVTLPMTPSRAVQADLHAKVPVVLSAVPNETLAFVPTLLVDLADSSLVYKLITSVLFKDRAEEVRQHYAESPDTAHIRDKAELLGVVSTDALVTCYVRYMARLISQQGSPALLSTFALPPHSSYMSTDRRCVTGPPQGAACHAGDVAFQLPVSERMASRTHVGYQGPDEAALAKQYAKAIIDFAAGRPAPFEPYDAAADAGTSWDAGGPRRTRQYHKSHCDFLESIGFNQDPWGAASAPGSAETLVV